MPKSMYRFSELFAQLGLPDDDEGILQFLTKHADMAEGFRLPDAPYWTSAQAAFLKEALSQDSDWTGVVDQLCNALRTPEPTPPTPSTQSPCP
jgi:hypothetical protein